MKPILFKSELKDAREKCNISQERLAYRVGVSRETIRNVENGTQIPNVLLAINLSNVVGVEIRDLFKFLDK